MSENIAELLKAGGQWQNRLENLEQSFIENQKGIDSIIASGNGRKGATNQKTLGNYIYEQVQERKTEMEDALRSKTGKFSIDLKAAGTLLISDHLTGNGEVSYTQPSISPNNLVNFRDLIRTTQSPTGSAVTYQEGTVTNSFAEQTEGSSKAVQDYTWNSEKVDSKYVAAISTFSKQLLYSLPFLQNTLVRQLSRDFFIKENQLFFVTAAGNATGSVSIPGGVTTDAEELIYVIASQIDASYSPSYAIVKPTQWARILNTKPNDYSVPGGFSIDSNGNVRVGGVPLIPAAWGQSDHVLVFDANYIERLETESMRCEFSYEHANNFAENKITVRLECFEKLHVIRPDSLRYYDFGNS